jgi:hypothetical protein
MTKHATRVRKDKQRRAKLRARLEAEGASPALVERIIERQRWDDLVARHGLDEAQRIRSAEAHRNDPDDQGYSPSEGDPLLRGPGRVGGITAKVVCRRETITRWQYDRMTGGGA